VARASSPFNERLARISTIAVLRGLRKYFHFNERLARISTREVLRGLRK
jgi:hypothetical protein